VGGRNACGHTAEESCYTAREGFRVSRWPSPMHRQVVPWVLGTIARKSSSVQRTEQFWQDRLTPRECCGWGGRGCVLGPVRLVLQHESRGTCGELAGILKSASPSVSSSVVWGNARLCVERRRIGGTSGVGSGGHSCPRCFFCSCFASRKYWASLLCRFFVFDDRTRRTGGRSRRVDFSDGLGAVQGFVACSWPTTQGGWGG